VVSLFLDVEENNRSNGPGQIKPHIMILVKTSKPIYMGLNQFLGFFYNLNVGSICPGWSKDFYNSRSDYGKNGVHFNQHTIIVLVTITSL